MGHVSTVCWVGYLQHWYIHSGTQHLITAAWDPDGPDDDPDRGNPLSRSWKKILRRPQSTFHRSMARGPPRPLICLFLFCFLCVPGVEPGEAEPGLDDEPDREPARRVQRSPQTLHGTLLCDTAVVQRYGTIPTDAGRDGTIWHSTVRYGPFRYGAVRLSADYR